MAKNTNFKTVKRKAKVGERILIVDADSPFGTYKNGDVFTTEREVGGGIHVCEHATLIFDCEYEVIIENETEADVEMGKGIIKQIQAEIETLKAKVERLEKAEDFREQMRTAIKSAKPVGLKSPQQQRDEIVDRAKRDVAELKNGNYYDVPDPHSPRFPFNCNADFIVNREKRTVVVLMRGAATGDIRAKGIAKCAPNDCFNVHIGRAIALRRALGLEVPAEYLNAPQPTVVRDYDRIVSDEGETYTVTPGENYDHKIEGKQCQKDAPAAIGARIIDDSREGVSE